jgi:hypothetical protein
MTARRLTSFLVASLVLASFICGIAGRSSSPSEPAYGGKRLSLWLNELCALDSFKQAELGRSQILAVRSIGTNAIPWLLAEFRRGGLPWQWELNQLLNKQRLIKYRFLDADHRLYRATVGFRALGEMAEPAIPKLLSLVEAYPGYVPGTLAGIGRPALPALQQCLTNMTLYTNSLGSYAIIPGNTISDIYNATSYGPFSKSDIGILLPAIEAWAQQTTNRQAQTKAMWFLSGYDQLK